MLKKYPNLHPPPLSRFIPDHPILSLLSAASRLSIDPRSLHANTITSGLILHPFPASRLVQFLLSSNLLPYALAVFHSLSHPPDPFTYNALIAALTRQNSPAIAVSYYFRMRAAHSSPPNAYTFALLVKASAGSEDKIHCQVLKCGACHLLVVNNSLLNMYCNISRLNDARLLFDTSRKLDSISWNTLISAYGKQGEIQTARRLFDRMPDKNLISWSAMIDGYVRSGGFAEALRLFDGLRTAGFEPDVVTLVSVLKACAHSGSLGLGRWIRLRIERNGLDVHANVVLATALVELYSRCGLIGEAMEVFDRVVDRDVALWNAMIGGLARHGNGWRALELFEGMREREVAPNGTTFVGVLCACTHAGLVDEGMEVFESMRELGVEPRGEHYGCVADMLGRAGRVEEAEDVLLRMPVESEASQWGALMSACRTHGDVAVGERVGKRLISMEPDDAGRYVMMANVYAAAGRWDDMRGARREMEEKGIRKKTGFSFVE